MILISMLLVIVGAVTLVIGVFFGSEDNLTLIYVSIAACLLAGLFLVAGILRNRPSRKPVLGSDGAEATWSGATAWPGAGGGEAPRAAAPAATAVLERDEEPVRSEVQIVTARPDAGEASEAIGDEPTSADLERAEAADEDDDVVVVPKRAAEPIAERAVAPARKAAAKKAAPAKKAAAKKSTAKKSTAKKSTAKKAAPAKKAAAKKSTAKKAAPAKKAAAKKSTAKKTTAKKVTPPAKKAAKRPNR